MIGKFNDLPKRKNGDYIDCVNIEVNTTNANVKMFSRLLMSVSQDKMERTKVGLVGAMKKGKTK